MIPTVPSPIPPPNWDRNGLPAWAYLSDELLELEREVLFLRHWQLIGHISDLPNPGDYITLDVVDERALIIRGQDNQLRAFHNVCRHRGSRLVSDCRGSCGTVLVCPFHGWSYHLDGTLRCPSRPQTLPQLDRHQYGLKPIEIEIWNGFVFIRFQPGQQPSVEQILARFTDQVAPYQPERLLPASKHHFTSELAVNWKSVRDVDNEGYHVATAHPGLHDLYGNHYTDEPLIAGAARTVAGFNDDPGHCWSVRHYKRILPEPTWLPPSQRRVWWYIGLFPNTVLGLYPDSVIFYQEFPLTTRRTLIRSGCYRRRDEDRRLRLARYLSGRIDSQASTEDKRLAVWTFDAYRSSGYDGIILSDAEYGVRSYHDHLRTLMPVLESATPPAAGTLTATNTRLGSRSPIPAPHA